MENILDVLLEYGSLGIFAAFLVWQHLSMQKRLDNLVDKFQHQIEKIRDDHRSDVDGLRDRYDSVISNYNSDLSSLKESIADRVNRNQQEIEQLQKAIERQEQKIDGIYVAVEQCSSLLKDMATEQRIRLAAINASQK